MMIHAYLAPLRALHLEIFAGSCPNTPPIPILWAPHIPRYKTPINI